MGYINTLFFLTVSLSVLLLTNQSLTIFRNHHGFLDAYLNNHTVLTVNETNSQWETSFGYLVAADNLAVPLATVFLVALTNGVFSKADAAACLFVHAVAWSAAILRVENIAVNRYLQVAPAFEWDRDVSHAVLYLLLFCLVLVWNDKRDWNDRHIPNTVIYKRLSLVHVGSLLFHGMFCYLALTNPDYVFSRFTNEKSSVLVKHLLIPWIGYLNLSITAIQLSIFIFQEQTIYALLAQSMFFFGFLIHSFVWFLGLAATPGAKFALLPMLTEAIFIGLYAWIGLTYPPNQIAHEWDKPVYEPHMLAEY